MAYYLATALQMPLDKAIERVEAALSDQGFGVLTRVDVSQTLRDKLDVSFHPYVILGACNPQLAHEALQIEDKVGTMLPCNVVVQELTPGETEVAAIDPVASLQSIENLKLKAAATQVRDKLSEVINSLSAFSE